VIFEIREGPKVRVKDVVLRGNESMPDTGTLFWKDGISALAQRELAGPRLFNWLGDEFVAEILDADLVAMREVYRDRGWLDAVVEVERLEFSDDRSRVTIHVRVDEGLPYRVSKLTIRAVAPDETGRDWEPAELLFSEAELLDLLELAPGKRYERSTQRKDEIALRQHYGKRGYLSHPSLRGLDPFEFLDPDLRFDLDAHEVEVTYRISQGRKRFLREVLFEGGEYTRDRVLRREVRALPGEIADLEEINRSLRRLSETSYFSDDFLPLDHQEPTYRFLPVEGDPSLVDLEYRIQEGRVVNFQIQGGVDSNSGLFGRISLSMRNFDIADAPESLWSVFGDVYDKEAFHGAGQRLDLELSPGTEINYYRVRFVEPDLFRTHFERYSLDAELKSQVQSFRAYDEERISRTVRIGREFGTKVFAKVGYTNQDLFIDDIDAPLAGINDPTGFPLPEGLFEQEGSSDLNGGLFDLSYRDVDTTINTREGFLAVMRNGLYGGAFGGDYQYVRSQLDLDWYWQLGPEEEDVRPGIHLGLGMGIGDGFGDSDEVPYTERFFLGGSKTLRGFDFRGVGPSVGGEPIGGETMLSGTLEYRRPLYSTVQPGTYRRQEIFRLVLFADAGILDPDPWSVDLDEVRASLGFGIGMAYPIPIAINFGFPIASKDGDREEVFSFTIFSLWF
jgi:outer membrane protein insertion porin family